MKNLNSIFLLVILFLTGCGIADGVNIDLLHGAKKLEPIITFEIKNNSSQDLDVGMFKYVVSEPTIYDIPIIPKNTSRTVTVDLTEGGSGALTHKYTLYLSVENKAEWNRHSLAVYNVLEDGFYFGEVVKEVTVTDSITTDGAVKITVTKETYK